MGQHSYCKQLNVSAMQYVQINDVLAKPLNARSPGAIFHSIFNKNIGK